MMNVHVKNTNVVLTPEIQDYLDKKMNALERLIDPEDTSVSCQVELARTSNHHKSGDVFRVEINLMKSGKQFRAVAEQDTLMSAMDEAKDEIVGELKSFKSKQMTMMRRGGAVIKNMLKGIGDFGGSVGSSIGGGISRSARGLGRGVGNFGGSVGRKLKGWRKGGER